MTSLHDRLKALGVSIGTNNLPKPSQIGNGAHPISGVLPGDWWHTAHGDIFFVETRYKADFQLGEVNISPIGPLDIIAAWAREPDLKKYSIEQFAFIDTETTGLSSGTGTYTFLIGVGRFEEDHFRLVQFFLSNPGEETAQLAAFEEFLSPCEAVVSFNGKSFDIPLINTRYITNGWSSPLEHIPHIDLLHLARRLWKERLPRRSLGDLEWHILKAKRSEKDVPGWMVADLYFDYLHTGDARPLLGVFYHNEIDVLSLAALMSHMSIIVSDPFNGTVKHGLDMAAIGKLYADLGYLDDAAKFYQGALDDESLDHEQFINILNRFSFVQKKRGDLNAAKSLWKIATDHQQIYAFEELAKVCEHHECDFSSALHWTENALTLIWDQAVTPNTREYWEESLLHRKKRLQRKMSHRKLNKK